MWVMKVATLHAGYVHFFFNDRYIPKYNVLTRFLRGINKTQAIKCICIVRMHICYLKLDFP